ncbi:unnamed protein product [Prunus armeniaca]
MTINTHQPARGTTRSDKLWRDPSKLNLLSCPMGRATKGIDPWELEKKLANHARGTEDVDLNDLPCKQRMTINVHQPARGPTRSDKLQRNPHKLNLLICLTGRATKGIDPWELEKKLANHARGTEDVDLNDLPCEQRMMINAHQPARGPTRSDKLQRNPHKLNLLICLTGRAPKGIDHWEPRKKLASRARGTEYVGPRLKPCEQRMSRS